MKKFATVTIITMMMLTACTTNPINQGSKVQSKPDLVTVIAPIPIQIVSENQNLPTLSVHKSEQPIAVNNNIWIRIRDSLQLDRHLDNRTVKERIAWYARNQAYLDRVIQRATPYIYHIVEELEKRNMPLDLALLPVVESAFHPFAYSRSHASGIWQFIPGTGKMYGLKQNWWYDGRRDIVAATRAALDYLEKLNKQFNGDWQHSLAAYNSGERNVERAIKRNKTTNKATDFFSLQLPKETRGYVPSLLAIAEIIADPKKYNVNLNPIANEPYFEKIDIDGQIDLSIAAELAGLSMDELYTLNPGFNRWATDPDGPHYLLIPLTIKEKFIAGLTAIPIDQRVAWNQHIIQSGESLSQIAEKYKTSVNTIRETNNIRGNLIHVGKSLVIPSSKQPGKFYTLSLDNRWLGDLKKEGTGDKYIYTVRSGDSLWTISRRYDISINQLCEWNGIKARSILNLGQKVTLWINSPGKKPQQLAASATLVKTSHSLNEEGHIQYTVKKGDSLWLISRRFGVTIAQLQMWNKLSKGKHLQPGQTLVLLDAPALATGA
jgi:membrane-bound lytic murein transglycosylase D